MPCTDGVAAPTNHLGAGVYGPNTRDAMLWYGYSSTAGKYRCGRMIHMGGS